MSSDNFSQHPKLSADTLLVSDLALCRILLMNDSTFPWLILLPMRNDKCELHDLSPDDYKLAMEEVRFVSEKFAAHTNADKINTAALGNMVPQLHIHVIARFKNDPAWPNPVWNCGHESKPYISGEIASIAGELASLFQCKTNK